MVPRKLSGWDALAARARRRARAASVVVFGFVVACGTTNPEDNAASITISPPSAQFSSVGDNVQFAATVLDDEGQVIADAAVTWSSGASAVATVSAAGLVAAVANGATMITATSGPASASVQVTVAQVPVGMDIAPASHTLVSLGETIQLEAAVRDAKGNPIPGQATLWESSDPAVATVNGTGLVTAWADGMVVVGAAILDFSSTAQVTVDQRAATIVLTPADTTFLSFGDTVRLAIDAKDAGGNALVEPEFAWSSTDAQIATVDEDGLVTSVGDGTASISASTDGTSGSASITVAQQLIGLDIAPAAHTFFALGDTVRLEARAVDANNQTVDAGFVFTWSSKHAGIATVDDSGLVTAVRTGSADIYVRGGEYLDSAAISVAQLAAEVRVTPDTATLNAIGQTVRLAALAVDANGHEVEDTDYEWSAPHPGIVTVDSRGIVTAVGPGTGEIRVKATRAGGNRVGVAVITVRPST